MAAASDTKYGSWSIWSGDRHVHALRVGTEPGREVGRKQIELLLRTSMRYQRLERPLRRILIQIESEISIDFNMWSLSSMSWRWHR
jgi:hypothetical protein